MTTRLAAAGVEERPVGMWELADPAAEYRVGKSTVSNWPVRYPDFPRPLVTLSTGPVFSRQQVREWYARWATRPRR